MDHLLTQGSVVALSDPREVKERLFEILMCPTCKRSGLIQDHNAFLECNCGSRFKKHQGILALRPNDKFTDNEGEFLDELERKSALYRNATFEGFAPDLLSIALLNGLMFTFPCK